MDLDVYLSAIVDGNTHAFAAWMSGAEERVRLSIRSFARQVDVEAVLQEALLRVWQVAPRFVPDGRQDGLLRLAIRIARNLAISEVRKQRPDATPPEDMDEIVVDPARAPDPLLRQAIAFCREKLPEQPRRALDARLTSGGGDDDAAIAQQLNMRLNTFLQNFTRARKLLAECLGKQGIVLDQELGA